jgi:alpha-beta hydrolase superfamily lysophospholipase
MEYNIALGNGQVLKGFIKSAGDSTRAIVIMVHGLGEHIQRYSHWAELFNGNNIGFTGVDLPGHGRSDGKRGHLNDETLLTEMLDILLNEIRKTFPGLPIFIYGHSLGGLITLNYLLRKKPGVMGAIVTSPPLRLAFQPPKVKILLASIMKHIFPGMLQPSGLPVKYISHDEEVVKKYQSDPLVHSKISVNLFHSFMSYQKFCNTNPGELKTPLLLVHGDDDHICSPEGSKAFAAGSGSTELKMWPGGWHELHNEPFKKEVFDFILNWMNSRISR